MEILLWLVPPAAVTVLAMAWVSWLGREGRGEVSRDEAVARLGAALDREPRRRRPRPGYAAPAPPPDRSSGVTLRAGARDRTRLTARPGGRDAGPSRRDRPDRQRPERRERRAS